MPTILGTINSTTGSAAGAVDFTIPGFGNVTGAMIFGVGPPNEHEGVYGFIDQNNTNGVISYHKDRHKWINGKCYSRPYNGLVGAGIIITDGVRITFSGGTPNDRPLTIILIKGSQTHVITYTPGNTATITPNFEAGLVVVASILKPYSGGQPQYDGWFNLGFGDNELNQFALDFRRQSNTTFRDNIHSYTGTLHTITSTSYKVSGNKYAGTYFSIEKNVDSAFNVRTILTRTTPGIDSTNVGFNVGSVFGLASLQPTLNVTVPYGNNYINNTRSHGFDNNTSLALAMGSSNLLHSYASPSQFIDLKYDANDDGIPTDFVQATIATTSSGYDLNYSVVDSTAYLVGMVALEAVVTSITLIIDTDNQGFASFSPTLNLTENFALSPQLDNQGFASFPPTIKVSNHFTVIPQLDNQGFTSFSPTLNLTENFAFAPGIGNQGFTELPLTLAISEHQTVTPQLDISILSTFGLTLAVSEHQLLMPNISNININGMGIDIVETANIAIPIDLNNISFNGLDITSHLNIPLGKTNISSDGMPLTLSGATRLIDVGIDTIDMSGETLSVRVDSFSGDSMVSDSISDIFPSGISGTRDVTIPAFGMPTGAIIYVTGGNDDRICFAQGMLDSDGNMRSYSFFNQTTTQNRHLWNNDKIVNLQGIIGFVATGALITDGIRFTMPNTLTGTDDYHVNVVLFKNVKTKCLTHLMAQGITSENTFFTPEVIFMMAPDDVLPNSENLFLDTGQTILGVANTTGQWVHSRAIEGGVGQTHGQMTSGKIFRETDTTASSEITLNDTGFTIANDFNFGDSYIFAIEKHPNTKSDVRLLASGTSPPSVSYIDVGFQPKTIIISATGLSQDGIFEHNTIGASSFGVGINGITSLNVAKQLDSINATIFPHPNADIYLTQHDGASFVPLIVGGVNNTSTGYVFSYATVAANPHLSGILSFQQETVVTYITPQVGAYSYNGQPVLPIVTQNITTNVQPTNIALSSYTLTLNNTLPISPDDVTIGGQNLTILKTEHMLIDVGIDNINMSGFPLVVDATDNLIIDIQASIISLFGMPLSAVCGIFVDVAMSDFIMSGDTVAIDISDNVAIPIGINDVSYDGMSPSLSQSFDAFIPTNTGVMSVDGKNVEAVLSDMLIFDIATTQMNIGGNSLVLNLVVPIGNANITISGRNINVLNPRTINIDTFNDVDMSGVSPFLKTTEVIYNTPDNRILYSGNDDRILSFLSGNN